MSSPTDAFGTIQAPIPIPAQGTAAGVHAGIQDGIQIAENIARMQQLKQQTQIQKATLEISKQQHLADILDKATTSSPGASKIMAGAYSDAYKNFYGRDPNPDTLKYFTQTDEGRQKIQGVLTNIDPNDPLSAIKARAQLNAMADSNIAVPDAVKSLDEYQKQLTMIQATKLRGQNLLNLQNNKNQGQINLENQKQQGRIDLANTKDQLTTNEQQTLENLRQQGRMSLANANSENKKTQQQDQSLNQAAAKWAGYFGNDIPTAKSFLSGNMTSDQQKNYLSQIGDKTPAALALKKAQNDTLRANAQLNKPNTSEIKTNISVIKDINNADKSLKDEISKSNSALALLGKDDNAVKMRTMTAVLDSMNKILTGAGRNSEYLQSKLNYESLELKVKNYFDVASSQGPDTMADPTFVKDVRNMLSTVRSEYQKDSKSFVIERAESYRGQVKDAVLNGLYKAKKITPQDIQAYKTNVQGYELGGSGSSGVGAQSNQQTQKIYTRSEVETRLKQYYLQNQKKNLSPDEVNQLIDNFRKQGNKIKD